METHYKTSNGHQWALVPWFLKKKKRKRKRKKKKKKLNPFQR